MLHEAIEAIRRRQPARARDILTRLLRSDPNNPVYWIWMSSVVDAVTEQAYCLKTAQKLDPNNQTAARGLCLIGEGSTYENVQPIPPVRRHWSVAERDIHEMSTFSRLWANPILRLTVLIAHSAACDSAFRNWLCLSGQASCPSDGSNPHSNPGAYSNLYLNANSSQRETQRPNCSPGNNRNGTALGIPRRNLHTNTFLCEYAACCQ